MRAEPLALNRERERILRYLRHRLAREPGWGGSGRNGGQVIPGIKYDPEDLRAKFAPETAERLIRFVGGTADIGWPASRAGVKRSRGSTSRTASVNSM